MLSGVEPNQSVRFDDCVVEFEIDDLSAEYKEIARKELRETPDVVKHAVATLQDLLKDEKDLYVPIENEAFLIKFLRPTKFYPESALELMKRHYSFKVKHKDAFEGLVPKTVEKVFLQDMLLLLPNRDQHGRRMLILELGKKWKPSAVSLDEVFQAAVLLVEAVLWEQTTQIAGGVVLFDMDGLSLSQTSKFTPIFIKKMVDWLQDTLAARVKAIHVINQPYVFNIIFAIVKPLLREKLRNRLYLHGKDRKSLFDHINSKCLPKHLGGTLDVTVPTSTQWYQLLKKYEKEYEVLNTYGYNKKRPE